MVFEARFARKDCTPCPFRPQCTRSKTEPRIIGLQTRELPEDNPALKHQLLDRDNLIARMLPGRG